VREVADGRVLVHCFAGCETSDVLRSIGLQLSDLFVHPVGHHCSPARNKGHLHATREALRTIHAKALVVAIAAETQAGGVPLDEIDRAQLREAAISIRAAVEAAM
jgi:hypothetical protein